MTATQPLDFGTLESVYVDLSGVVRSATGEVWDPELRFFDQEPDTCFPGPFYNLVRTGVIVEDRELYDRAVDVATRLLAELTAEGHKDDAWRLSEALEPFVRMHEGVHAA